MQRAIRGELGALPAVEVGVEVKPSGPCPFSSTMRTTAFHRAWRWKRHRVRVVRFDCCASANQSQKAEKGRSGTPSTLRLGARASQPIWKVEVCYGIGAVWTCING